MSYSALQIWGIIRRWQLALSWWFSFWGSLATTRYAAGVLRLLRAIRRSPSCTGAGRATGAGLRAEQPDAVTSDYGNVALAVGLWTKQVILGDLAGFGAHYTGLAVRSCCRAGAGELI
jgi:hypothetical protein